MPRKPKEIHRTSTVASRVSEELAERLKAFARKHDVSESTIFRFAITSFLDDHADDQPIFSKPKE